MEVQRKHLLSPDLWLKTYGDYLYSYCVLRISQRETAEDLVQETLISALKARETFKGESSERTWLVSILKNKIIDHYRKSRLKTESLSDYADNSQEFDSRFFRADDGHWLRETAPKQWSETADSALERQEFMSVLQMCISKMPKTLVPIFIARFLDDEDSETICKDHQISASNYWVILHRAKILIRSCLEKNWFYSKMG